MNKRKVGGLFFTFLGMVLTLGNVQITGAVIGGGSFLSWIGMVGMLSFLVGGVMVLMGESAYREETAGELEKRAMRFAESALEEPATDIDYGTIRSVRKYLSKEKQRTRKYAKAQAPNNMTARDWDIYSRLDNKEKIKYHTINDSIHEIIKTVGGHKNYFVKPLEQGDVTYVHFTKKKSSAESIVKTGLKKPGPNTRSQAFIFTGENSYLDAKNFVSTVDPKRTLNGAGFKPKSSVIFRTPVIPTINDFSGKVPRGYKNNWKAMFDYDLPSSLMNDVQKVNL